MSDVKLPTCTASELRLWQFLRARPHSLIAAQLLSRPGKPGAVGLPSQCSLLNGHVAQAMLLLDMPIFLATGFFHDQGKKRSEKVRSWTQE